MCRPRECEKKDEKDAPIGQNELETTKKRGEEKGNKLNAH